MALGNIHIFSVIQCILFKIFLQFSLPPPYTMLKFGKNSGYTRPTLFVGRGEGLGMSELENAQMVTRRHTSPLYTDRPGECIPVW